MLGVGTALYKKGLEQVRGEMLLYHTLNRLTVEKCDFPVILIEAFGEVIVIGLFEPGYIPHANEIFPLSAPIVAFDKYVIEYVSACSDLHLQLAGSVLDLRVLHDVNEVCHQILQGLRVQLVEHLLFGTD